MIVDTGTFKAITAERDQLAADVTTLNGIVQRLAREIPVTAAELVLQAVIASRGGRKPAPRHAARRGHLRLVE